MSVAISARTPDYRPSPPPPQPPQKRLASKMPARVQARPVASRPVASKPPSAGGPQQQHLASASAFPSSSSTPSSSAPSARAGPSRAVSAAGSSPAATTSGGMAPSPRQPVALAAPPGGKDLSSSTGKIFAKPSKEWVLPERAKPGRKASTDEPDNRRQSQNRLSQRAHRARRTDYIQTLEERLRKYEADEIHSNVRLQEVARALKQDNERMKKEIAALTSGLSAARSDRDTWQAERRQLNNQVRSLQNQLAQAEHRSPREYEYAAADVDYATSELGLRHSPGLTPLSAASPRNLVAPQVDTPRMSGASVSAASRSAPTALACPICPDPDPDCPCQQGNIGNTFTTLGPSRCGLCDLAPEACLCSGAGGSSGVSRVVTMDEDVKPIIPRSPSPVPADERGDCGLCTSEDFCACRAGLNLSSMVMSSPLVPTPAALPVAAASVSLPQSTGVAAPAVALRLRTRPAAKQSVWALDNVPAGTSRKEAVCTGDPSNCDACRNDSFGREFCENLFGTHDDEPSGSGSGSAPGSGSSNSNGAATPKKKCAGCGPGGCGSAPSVSIASLVNPPSSPIPQAPLVLACCGAPELCGHAGGCAGDVLIGPVDHDQLDDDEDNPAEEEEEEEVMRPDEAWHALKAHPNSRFTPLAILADVVARRSKCLGPRVELSPPPEGMPHHHHHHAPAPPSPVVANAAAAQQQARARASAHKRRLAVETSAVREALRFLDSATPAPESGRDAKRARV